MVQDGARWCKIVEDCARLCKIVQDSARQCKIVQDIADKLTADGAYHCPVGSIWLFLIPAEENLRSNFIVPVRVWSVLY